MIGSGSYLVAERWAIQLWPMTTHSGHLKRPTDRHAMAVLPSRRRSSNLEGMRLESLSPSSSGSSENRCPPHLPSSVLVKQIHVRSEFFHQIIVASYFHALWLWERIQAPPCNCRAKVHNRPGRSSRHYLRVNKLSRRRIVRS